jgi:hypothetical protein
MISRNGYHKSRGKEVNRRMEQLIVEMIVRERHLQPRLGCRKLYHMYAEQIHEVCLHPGRNRFFGLLRATGLLVLHKRSYTRTTNSYHRFWLWGGFTYLSLPTDYYSYKIAGWCLSCSSGIAGSMQALQMTLSECTCTEGLVHHSDWDTVLQRPLQGIATCARYRNQYDGR